MQISNQSFPAFSTSGLAINSTMTEGAFALRPDEPSNISPRL